MARLAPTTHAVCLVLFISAVAVVGACGSQSPLVQPAGDHLAAGTWGGDKAGVIVSDSDMHVHIGCTYGDVTGRVPLDSTGRFTVTGSYMLRAYPIAVGPTMPAQFAGHVSGGTLVLTVTVNDTVAHSDTVLGPATVVFGKTPSMGPCPICRTPADRKAHANNASSPPVRLRRSPHARAIERGRP
jgi:hypothetical protein